MKVDKRLQTKLENLKRSRQLFALKNRLGLPIVLKDALDLRIKLKESAVSQELQDTVDDTVSVVKEFEENEVAKTDEYLQEELGIKIGPHDVYYRWLELPIGIIVTHK